MFKALSLNYLKIEGTHKQHYYEFKTFLYEHIDNSDVVKDALKLVDTCLGNKIECFAETVSLVFPFELLDINIITNFFKIDPRV